MRIPLALVGLTLLAACGSGQTDKEDADGTGNMTVELPAGPVPDATPTAAPANDSAQNDADGEANGRALLPTGWGPLRIGMSKAAVTDALGPDVNPGDANGPDPDQCEIYRPEGAPVGMMVMLIDGRLARITLSRGSDVKTSAGIGVGATAAAVRAAYGARVKSSPHAYLDSPGEYLTLWSTGGPQSPSGRGIRFEIDRDGQVQFIHAGGPAIEYVEGCA